MVNPIEYIKETKQELTHVVWPTRKQAIAYTGIVILISLAVAAFLGLFDSLFYAIVKHFFIL